MPKPSLSSQLDAAIEAMLARRIEREEFAPEESKEAARFYGASASKGPAAGGDSEPPAVPEKLAQLLPVAASLRDLPREEFRARLKTELGRRTLMGSTAKPAPQPHKVKPVPEGYHTVAPYLAVRGAAEAIEFYKNAFGATEVMRLQMPDGKIGHAEVQIGDSRIMLSDEFPEYGARSPESFGGSPVDIHLYVEDVDAWANRAIAAGAKVLVPVADQDYGERHGRLEDPFGHHWGISTPLKQDRAREVRERFHTAAPHLVVADGVKAIEFYQEAFGAAELMRLTNPDGSIAHAEIAIGDSPIMLREEWPEYGRRGPQSLGGTPVKIHLFVDDVDALAAQAIAAGAKVVRPVQDQFYGDRSGQIEDPFGHVWIISSHIEDVSPEEIERRTAAFTAGETSEATHRAQPAAAGVSAAGVREGYTAITPYLTVRRAAELVDFVKEAFGAIEVYRGTGSAGGLHAEVKIGNSMVMIGGYEGVEEKPAALHYYVEDTDAVYQRALQAGATSMGPPTDHDYGERGASVKDAFGNNWYIATNQGDRHIREGFRSLTPYLHPQSAAKVIDFLRQAFEAEEIARHADPNGRIVHAEVRIGDSMLEMGEAHGPHQPMPSGIYLYVADVDATYKRALAAGATSVQPPADQPYGDRNAFVTDPFGTAWYLATYVRDTAA